MAIKAIRMPKWGLAMEEGTIIDWLIAEGDAVAEGDDPLDGCVQLPLLDLLCRPPDENASPKGTDPCLQEPLAAGEPLLGI